jgi:pilus assembly protein Flp/PilA
MSKIISTLPAFIRSENGASAAEYALILAIVGSGIAVAALFLGGAISGAINGAATCITTPTTANC